VIEGVKLNREQQLIVNKLKEKATEHSLDVWLSTPHKSFKDRAPLDVLLSGNYEYFYNYIGNIE